MQEIRNIAILAHVDAGKTTLSERILFSAGEVLRAGDVEEGLATMDYLPEEKDRGITIEAGVAHFEWRGVWFNLIDTPGHIDFGAEVDTALESVDAAVLVVSATSGVETQTISAWNKLKKQGVLSFIFINKLDNPHASIEETLFEIEDSLGVQAILLNIPEYSNGSLTTILDIISKTRLSHDSSGREQAIAISETSKNFDIYFNELIEFTSIFDDTVLEQALNQVKATPKQLIKALQALVQSDDYVLCYAGSALHNKGVRSLMTGLSFFIPPPPNHIQNVLGQVIRLRFFGDHGEVSLFKSMTSKSTLDLKGLQFYRMKANMLIPVTEIRKGDIYAMKSVKKMELGAFLDFNGSLLKEKESKKTQKKSYEALLQTQIECQSIEDFEKVDHSLKILSRIDPSFSVEMHPQGGYWVMHTVGEVQLEVLLARLKREFRCEVKASAPEVQWQERLNKKTNSYTNSFQVGTNKVSISISAKPLPNMERDIRLNASFLEEENREVLAGIRAALLETAEIGFLGKGPLVGVEFKIHSLEYTPGINIGMIKKACTDAVLLLIKEKDVILYEPYMLLYLESPVEYAGFVTNDIQSRHGIIREVGGDGKTHFLKAEVPLRNFFGYSTVLRSISKGKAHYEMQFLKFKEKAF